ncbi:MAG: hypothetical protein R3E83_20085 [Burkholderiaceae bacterium]
MSLASRRRFHRAGLGLLTGCAMAGIGGRARAQAARSGPTSPRSSARSVEFALLGDTSYDLAEGQDLRRLLPVAAAEAEFLIHVGDIKSGIESCEDAVLEHHLFTLASTDKPMVFVPGDNEWTDCHRIFAGSFDPLERLARLRALAYRPGRFLEPPGLERQSVAGQIWPEHQRWQAGPAQFVTLNVVGSKNGLTTSIPERAHRARAAAVRQWLLEAMARAQTAKLPVLVIALHAAISLEQLNARDLNADVLDENNPYGWIRALIWQVICRFDGDVMLMNGDQHVVIHDRPWWYGPFAAVAAAEFDVPLAAVQERMGRFRHVQTYGSPWSRHYLLISVAAVGDEAPLIQVQPKAI